MGAFRDEILGAKRVQKPSKIELIIASLPEEDAADLLTCLKDATIQTASIRRALERRGLPVSQSTIERYRFVNGWTS
jgi:hypothetical protein